MSGTLYSSEELIRKRLSSELRPDEKFVAGAAGRTKLRRLPQSMSLTGYFVALTTQRLIVYYYDRLTSRPAKVRAQIIRQGVESRDVTSTEARNSVHINLTLDAEVVFDLVFSGREKRAAAAIASSFNASSP